MNNSVHHSRLDRWLRLSWRKVIVVAVAWLLAAVLHNLLYALLYARSNANSDEGLFFLIATVLIPGYLIVAGVYTLIRKLIRKRR